MAMGAHVLISKYGLIVRTLYKALEQFSNLEYLSVKGHFLHLFLHA